MSEIIRLTQYSHGSGCGCKIAPQVLEKVLSNVGFQQSDPKLLVGRETSDDAAVYALDEEQAIVSTTDFFTPIVDDSYVFGRIAAANALSDVYAMGGQPMMAVAILGWPVDKLPPEMASTVIEGGRSICQEAGIPLAGGHSIDSPEPFFGLAVTGRVNRADLRRNDGAQIGDRIFITKAIGTGMLSAALKRGKMEASEMESAFTQMQEINRFGGKLSGLSGVNAVTDITGFGLAGHLLEMTKGSDLSVRLRFDSIPLMEGALDLAKAMVIPDNTYRNFSGYGTRVSKMSGDQLHVLCDPQTNGGLLMAVSPDGVEDFLARAEEEDQTVHEIGVFVGREEKELIVE